MGHRTWSPITLVIGENSLPCFRTREEIGNAFLCFTLFVLRFPSLPDPPWKTTNKPASKYPGTKCRRVFHHCFLLILIFVVVLVIPFTSIYRTFRSSKRSFPLSASEHRDEANPGNWLRWRGQPNLLQREQFHVARRRQEYMRRFASQDQDALRSVNSFPS